MVRFGHSPTIDTEESVPCLERRILARDGVRLRMRGGVVAAGVLMMMIGAFLFFFAPQVGGSASNSGSGFSFGAINIASTAFFGIVIGFIGFIVFIAGLAASPTPVVALPGRFAQASPTYSELPPSQAQPGSGDERGRRQWATETGSLITPAATMAQLPANPSPPVTAVSTVDTAPPIPGSSLFCPYCGASTKSEYKFCRSCGKQAPEA